MLQLYQIILINPILNRYLLYSKCLQLKNTICKVKKHVFTIVKYA